MTHKILVELYTRENDQAFSITINVFRIIFPKIWNAKLIMPN